MRRDDELGILVHKLSHAAKHRKLFSRRERSFGLVQDVEASPAEPIHHESEKRFAVRLLMKRKPAIRIDNCGLSVRRLGIQAFYFRRDIKKLSARKK